MVKQNIYPWSSYRNMRPREAGSTAQCGPVLPHMEMTGGGGDSVVLCSPGRVNVPSQSSHILHTPGWAQTTHGKLNCDPQSESEDDLAVGFSNFQPPGCPGWEHLWSRLLLLSRHGGSLSGKCWGRNRSLSLLSPPGPHITHTLQSPLPPCQDQHL